jgi:coatomer subunit zeta
MEECLENITKNNMTKKSVMENYQQLALMIDEMVDEGIIINTDSESIESRVYMRDNKINVEASGASGGGYFKSVRNYI